MRTLALLVLLSTGCTLHVASDQRLDDLTARQGRDEQRLDVADRNFAVLSQQLQALSQKLAEKKEGAK